jgi:hypothetical protein
MRTSKGRDSGYHFGFRVSAHERAEVEAIIQQYDVSQSAIFRTWIREGLDRLKQGEPLTLKPILDQGAEREAA